MSYVDGFILPIPRDKLDAYKSMATAAGEVWMAHGALSYVEAVADDVPYGELTSFPRSVKLEDNEVVVFAFITYKSREHRDEVNAKCMNDPRLKCDPDNMPFDSKRMIFGGFSAFVQK